MPVFKEGESVEPVLRALTAAVSVPHEILVVYDFDEDPTVPVIDRLSAELPAVRGSPERPRAGGVERDEGRDRGSTRSVRARLDGRRFRRAHRRRPDGRFGTRRRRRRVGIPLHARRSPDRRTGPQATDEPDGRPDAPLVRRRSDSRPYEQLQALLAPLPRHSDDREHRRLRARARADGQGHDRQAPSRRGPDDMARPDRRREQLQAAEMAPALPALVSRRVHGSIADVARPDRWKGSVSRSRGSGYRPGSWRSICSGSLASRRWRSMLGTTSERRPTGSRAATPG